MAPALLALLGLLACADNALAEGPVGALSLASTNPFVWDAMEKFARKEEMNQNASFVFWVTNTSGSNASIIHTESSCDCTVAKMPSQPWILKAGESGALGVTMNLLGRHGRVTKEIFVGTSHGGQILKVHADIPLTPAPFNVPVRQRDMMAAQKDRQAVFSGGCAACHAWPAAGRTGAFLFSKACGICHVSDHRAAMVPDLAALKHSTNADYWRHWITHGKEGTLMPAFAKSSGGILDSAQIDSLVDFLMTNFPSLNLPATNPAVKSSPISVP